MIKFKPGDVITPIDGGIIELIIDVTNTSKRGPSYLTFAIQLGVRIEYYSIPLTDRRYTILLDDEKADDLRMKYKIHQLTEIIEK